LFRRENPTVREYSEKWLEMQSPRLSYATMKGYQNAIKNYIVKPLGDMYMSDVRLDDLRVAMVPISQMSSKTYDHVNMLIKQIFKSALRSGFIDYDSSEELPARGGVPVKPRQALTDEQVKTLLASIKETPVYLFILIGLYAGLRREEILGLQWDCVFLDVENAVYFCAAGVALSPQPSGSNRKAEIQSCQERYPDTENIAESSAEGKRTWKG
jgi:integrase